MPSLPRWAVPFIALSLSVTATADLFGAQPTPREHAARRLAGERPDDPPGIPAILLRGTQPAAEITFGSWTHVQVNVGPGGVDILGDAANEPSIAVDPTNPLHMAIGWRQFATITSNYREAGRAWTANGGQDWMFAGTLDEGVFRSDPVLDYDAAGNFYYNSLKVVGNAFDCSVFTSNTGGVGWSGPVFAYGGDKCWMTVDRTGGASDGFIYSTWSIASNPTPGNQFNRSTDGGATFEFPVAIPHQPVWGTLDVGPNGNVYVAGIDPSDASIIYVARSTNAKNPMVTPTFDFVAVLSMGGIVQSFLGGSPNPGGLLGQVQIVADQTPSGPTAGNLYLLASVDPPGADPLDIRFIRGFNNGLTWGASQRVNDDPTNNGAWQWFGTMSVAPDGRIDVVWNDTRNTGLATQSQLFHTSSTDGGGTWATSEQISPTFDSTIGYPNQNKLGDYYDMVSDDVGANLAWSATFTGGQDVYYTRIGDHDCNGNGVADSTDIDLGTSLDTNGNGIPDECDAVSTAAASPSRRGAFVLHQNYPNPFNPTTTIDFEVASGGAHVTLAIYDISGRLVRTLVDEFRVEGPDRAHWDGRDSEGRRVASGIYFCRLEAPGFSESRKLVLMK